MRQLILPALLVLGAAPHVRAADAEEARIQAALAGRGRAAAAKPAPAKPASAKPAAARDADAALVGQRVRVTTTERGLYIGTLGALDRDTVKLVLDLPTRQVAYALPRALVARIEPL